MKQTFGKPLPQKDAASSTLRSLAPELAEQESLGNRIRLLGSFDPELPKAFEELNAARAAAKGTEPGVPGVDKKIGMEDIREQKAKGLEEGTERARRAGRKIVNYGIGLKALWDAYHLNVGRVGEDVAIGYSGYKAADAFAKLLERPGIKEMLTRPTPADIAQIPPEIRGNLGPMLEAAEARGIKVSPALRAVATGAAVAGTPNKGVARALTPGGSE